MLSVQFIIRLSLRHVRRIADNISWSLRNFCQISTTTSVWKSSAWTTANGYQKAKALEIWPGWSKHLPNGLDKLDVATLDYALLGRLLYDTSETPVIYIIRIFYILFPNSARRCLADIIHTDNVSSDVTPRPTCVLLIISPCSSIMTVKVASSKGSSKDVGSENICNLIVDYEQDLWSIALKHTHQIHQSSSRLVDIPNLGE